MEEVNVKAMELAYYRQADSRSIVCTTYSSQVRKHPFENNQVIRTVPGEDTSYVNKSWESLAWMVGGHEKVCRLATRSPICRFCTPPAGKNRESIFFELAI
jgi:hypothetical protein